MSYDPGTMGRSGHHFLIAFTGVVALTSCVAIGHEGKLVPFFATWGGGVTYYPNWALGTGRDDDGKSALAPALKVELDKETRRFLDANGLSVPVNPAQLRALYQALAAADDETLRHVLIGLGKAGCGTITHRRVELPEEFGARILLITMPLLELRFLGQRKDITASEEDHYLLPMLLRILEHMQYAPALKVFMRREGVFGLREAGYAQEHAPIWASFGREAVAPLAALARTPAGDEVIDLCRHDYALRALGQIRDPDAVPELRRLLDDADPEVCAAAAEALREMGEAK